MSSKHPAANAPAYFDSNDTAIHYTDMGNSDGPPMVLVHGLLVDQSLNWASARRILEADFRVIALDVRGHGRSEGPHDAGRYGREMALDVIRLLDHLDIARATVFGYSMGGMIAIWLAARFPERVHVAVIGGYAPASLLDDAQQVDPDEHPVGLAPRRPLHRVEAFPTFWLNRTPSMPICPCTVTNRSSSSTRNSGRFGSPPSRSATF